MWAFILKAAKVWGFKMFLYLLALAALSLLLMRYSSQNEKLKKELEIQQQLVQVLRTTIDEQNAAIRSWKAKGEEVKQQVQIVEKKVVEIQTNTDYQVQKILVEKLPDDMHSYAVKYAQALAEEWRK